MKVYYNLPDQTEIENKFADTIEKAPAEFRSIVELLIKIAADRQNKFMIELMEKYKFKLMWDLRSLEQEIDSENGVFVILESGGIEMKDFSPALIDKIRQQINKSLK